jgi:mono/diheme cytochrome c family protein
MSVPLLLLGLSSFLIVLCSIVSPDRLIAQTSTTTTKGTAPTAQEKAQAAEIWESRCTACHGTEGRGDGPGAAALNPKPLNFQKHDWQKATPNDQIAKAIVEGGGAVGLSDQMPANPDLEDEPGVVAALVGRVRGFSK